MGSAPDAPDVQHALQALLDDGLVEEGHVGGGARHVDRNLRGEAQSDDGVRLGHEECMVTRAVSYERVRGRLVWRSGRVHRIHCFFSECKHVRACPLPDAAVSIAAAIGYTSGQR